MDVTKMVVKIVGKERVQNLVQKNLAKWVSDLLEFTQKNHPLQEGEAFTSITLFKTEKSGVVAMVNSLDNRLDVIEKKQTYRVADLATQIEIDDE